MKIIDEDMKKRLSITKESGICAIDSGRDIKDGVYGFSYFINENFDLALGGYCADKATARGVYNTKQYGPTYNGLPVRFINPPLLPSHKPKSIDTISTVYEVAYSFIFESSLCFGSKEKREQVRSFLNDDFKKLASEVLIGDMNNLKIESINLMPNEACNELWRNTVWFAARCGLIRSSFNGVEFKAEKELKEKYTKPEFDIF